MNVKELKEKLEEFDDNLLVVCHGYEGGVYDEIHFREETIALDVNPPEKWYYGSHEIVNPEFDEKLIGEDYTKNKKVKGLVIG